MEISMISGNLVPVMVLVLVLPFVFVICILLIKSNEKYKRDRLRAELYMKALEKGEELPAGLIDQPKKKHDYLITGILMISVGAGIALVQGLNSHPGNYLQDMSGAMIPLCLGIGFLIVHLITKKQRIEDEQ